MADDRRASREDIACDIDVASAKGDSEAVMEEKACVGRGWVVGGDNGLDGGKVTVFAGEF